MLLCLAFTCASTGRMIAGLSLLANFSIMAFASFWITSACFVVAAFFCTFCGITGSTFRASCCMIACCRTLSLDLLLFNLGFCLFILTLANGIDTDKKHHDESHHQGTDNSNGSVFHFVCLLLLGKCRASINYWQLI